MGQILCCVSPGLPNEPELLEEDSGKSSRYRRGKKHRRKKDKSRRQKHRNHQPSNNDHGHVAQSPESRIEDSDDGRVGVATDATDRGTKTLTEIGFPDTEDEDEEATVNAEDVRIGRPASPTKFTHCENPGVACTLFRSYLAYHKDTLQVDAFGPLTPTSHGTEQVLQQFQSPMDDDKDRLTRRIAEFRARGGKVYLFDESSCSVENDRNVYPTVVLRQGDTVYPVCHAGQNRSQVLWALLQDMAMSFGAESTKSTTSSALEPPSLQVGTESNPIRNPMRVHKALRVVCPHGAESGFDPFKRAQNITEENYFEYCFGHISDEVGSRDQWMDERFRAALGRRKCRRFGDREGRNLHLMPVDCSRNDLALVARDRAHMKAFFESNYFSATARPDALEPCDLSEQAPPMSPRRPGCGRKVFFCFMRAFDICLGRILDANPRPTAGDGEQPLQDLQNFYVVGIALGDPIGNRHTKDASQETIDLGTEDDYRTMYEQYGRLVRFETS